ncbi:ADP-heptose synthase [Achromobacter xylosoxidans]|jgi:rfaE bifunctional protein nucleotidyltransferase chain/domain|uniref:D-beta-D-heptose 1-phosphate adenylyltransferase n=1 Tax=Achromobacter mucicolens TaxID=1389922 RepID=A0ABM8LJP6_9BURK|nr:MULTISPECIES: adenylyltransferase/cytidyltransferase family protein [Achromobacter]KXJ65296.1 ADP-heptose synthase [Achromobacter xylosoxidans]KRB09092.1 ADP-heptose synthase [Achromobacter sp. Root170]MCU6619841.1 adenylyltransferase/cytidyltransferase family protein [Achromobacter mucicolens]MDH0094206.1 adenylyltransferase/cytidyltransferase family protein [Achromobacter mucicolens]TQJ94987.1 rfaE bifunctional protein nucleotidyltransferase chain/domain [Achromobacter sp. SLBN-14]
MPAARFESKVLSRDELVAAVAAGRFPRPLVFTNGVFDILHRGHATYLDQAAQLGATLIVAVNTDESVRRLGKGAERPLNRMEDRAALLAALGFVSAVTSFSEDTPEALIGELRPDLIVKGGDYDMETLPETALVKTWGGRAVAIPFEFQRSTTALVKKIQGG